MGWWSNFLGGPQSQDRYTDDWLRGIERGLLSATGLHVTVENALTLPGISACLQVQSEDLAKVPLDLKRRSDRGYEPATDHPLYALLKFGPAPWLSPYRWRKAMVHRAMAHGNDFSRVWWSERGRIEKITPIQAGATVIRWAEDGEPYFDVRGAGGMVSRNLTWHDVIHIAYRDANTDGCANGGIVGVSPILQNKETVALMMAAEKFASLFFAHGAKPSIVLEYDKKLPNDEVEKRIRAGIERVYGGIDNKWKVAILELGMKMRELSGDPQNSQLLETRRYGGEQACMMYRTPPHKIGILDKATFSNIEQQSIDYVTGPISATARAVEAAITIACLTADEREIYKVEHNLDGLMRGDILSRYRAYAIGRQWGWLSADDVRETENRNKLPDGAGESYLTPLNMVPAGQDNPAQDGGGDDNQDRPGADDYLPSETRWTTPTHKLNGRASALVGPSGEPLYLH